MLVLVHVIIALSSVAYTTYLFLRPSKSKLQISYGLVVATLASGTYLVFVTRNNILQACITGLIYVGAVSVGIVLAQRKLTSANIRTND
ncbi:MAG: hypothetical protein V4702_05650 [Patescibacteria group bacterium]